MFTAAIGVESKKIIIKLLIKLNWLVWTLLQKQKFWQFRKISAMILEEHLFLPINLRRRIGHFQTKPKPAYQHKHYTNCQALWWKSDDLGTLSLWEPNRPCGGTPPCTTVKCEAIYVTAKPWTKLSHAGKQWSQSQQQIYRMAENEKIRGATMAQSTHLNLPQVLWQDHK